MQQMSDEELWNAIVQNTNAMSAVMHHQVDLEAGIGAPNDPDNRTMVLRACQQKLRKFAGEYAGYIAEIRRRYP